MLLLLLMMVVPQVVLTILIVASATATKEHRRDAKPLFNSRVSFPDFEAEELLVASNGASWETLPFFTPSTSFTPTPEIPTITSITLSTTTSSRAPTSYSTTTRTREPTTYSTTTRTREPTTYSTTTRTREPTTYSTTTRTREPTTYSTTTRTREPTTYSTTTRTIEPTTYSTTTVIPTRMTSTTQSTTATATTVSSTASQPTTTSSSVPPVSECTREYSCLNCSSGRVCAPTPDGESLYEIKRFTCPLPMPYCNYTTGTCSYTPDPDCSDTPAVVSSFICMRDGYFPDPSECSAYYHCKNEVAYQYTCVYPTPYYNPYIRNCDTYDGMCSDLVAECRNYTAGTKVNISGTDQYFVYCENKTVVAVDRCIGAYKFDPDFQMCLPTCPHEGLFPKVDDCANYYRCSPKSHVMYSGYVMADLVCPEGQGFSESDYSCVDRSFAPNCNATYPDLFNK